MNQAKEYAPNQVDPFKNTQFLQISLTKNEISVFNKFRLFDVSALPFSGTTYDYQEFDAVMVPSSAYLASTNCLWIDEVEQRCGNQTGIASFEWFNSPVLQVQFQLNTKEV